MKYEPGKLYYNNYTQAVYMFTGDYTFKRWWPGESTMSAGNSGHCLEGDHMTEYHGPIPKITGNMPEKWRKYLEVKVDNSYFYVWRSNGAAPVKKHATREDAEQEASRLAAKEPGAKFLVMHVVSEVQTEVPTVNVNKLC